MAKPTKKIDKKVKEKLTCGIIMPISALDGCDENHWLDVREILKDSIETSDLEPNLVSDANDVGIIQKRIIQNVYNNPIIICDVSGKNPNVMFELGLRLAFDKPTIIVKDDKTSYTFDTSPIEHIEYPRDLRYAKIIEFKEVLIEKIKGTMKKYNDDPGYSTFLKHFGTFKVAKVGTKEVSSDELIYDELKSIRSMILNQQFVSDSHKQRIIINSPSICLRNITQKQFDIILKELGKLKSFEIERTRQLRDGHYHIYYKSDFPNIRNEILACIRPITQRVRIMD
jgi:hypothetical protein